MLEQAGQLYAIAGFLRANSFVLLSVLAIACENGVVHDDQLNHSVNAADQRPGVGNDSALAVKLATLAFSSENEKVIFVVAAFQRSDSGYVVSIYPAPREGIASAGGGGTVFVSSAGESRIVSRDR